MPMHRAQHHRRDDNVSEYARGAHKAAHAPAPHAQARVGVRGSKNCIDGRGEHASFEEECKSAQQQENENERRQPE